MITLKYAFKKSEDLDKFNGMLKNFPKVYKSIDNELRQKNFVVELEYRSVILIEQMLQKPIQEIFNSDV